MTDIEINNTSLLNEAILAVLEKQEQDRLKHIAAVAKYKKTEKGKKAAARYREIYECNVCGKKLQKRNRRLHERTKFHQKIAEVCNKTLFKHGHPAQVVGDSDIESDFDEPPHCEIFGYDSDCDRGENGEMCDFCYPQWYAENADGEPAYF